jgi:hypothetical protein
MTPMLVCMIHMCVWVLCVCIYKYIFVCVCVCMCVCVYSCVQEYEKQR